VELVAVEMLVQLALRVLVLTDLTIRVAVAVVETLLVEHLLQLGQTAAVES
jgi:hypothetical protein